MRHSQIIYQTEQLLYNRSLISFASDEMTALWPNDSLTLIFYETFSNSIPNWAIIIIFISMISLESDEITTLWQNDYLTFTFYETLSNYKQIEQLL